MHIYFTIKRALIQIKIKTEPKLDSVLVWSMGLEPTRFNHTPLKRTRLPFRHDHKIFVQMVRGKGLEPSLCYQHEPESCASANSATLASTNILSQKNLKVNIFKVFFAYISSGEVYVDFLYKK